MSLSTIQGEALRQTLCFAIICTGFFMVVLLGSSKEALAQTHTERTQLPFLKQHFQEPKQALSSSTLEKIQLSVPQLGASLTTKDSSYGVLVQASDTGGAMVILTVLVLIPPALLLSGVTYVLATDSPNGQTGVGLASMVIFGGVAVLLAGGILVSGIKDPDTPGMAIAALISGALMGLSYLLYRRGQNAKKRVRQRLKKKVSYQLAPWLLPERGGVQGGLAFSGRF